MRKLLKFGKRIAVLIFIIALGICFGQQNLVLATEFNMDTFELEADLQNNLIGIADYFAANWEKAIQQRPTFPNTITSVESINLKMALSKNFNNSLGLFAESLGWLRATGDTARFYHDILDSANTNPKLYNLGIRFERIDLLGVYKQQKFEIAKMQFLWEGNLFSCLDYQKIEASGFGLLTLDSDNQRQTDIYANYQRINTDSGELGWGTRLSWKTAVEFNPKTELKLRISNLPGIIYFPSLVHEKGTVDSSPASIGPVSIYGSSQKRAAWNIMPVATQVSLLFKTPGGKIEVQGFRLGDLYDISAGYTYILNEQLTSEMLFSPITNKFGLGFQSAKIKLKIVMDSGYYWMIDGITLSVNI